MSSYLYHFLREKGLVIVRSGATLPNATLNEAEVAALEVKYNNYAFAKAVAESEKAAKEYHG